ncbi:MAG TPA: ComF family protein [Fimbriimonadaceae bacterium]|nr:ComF family protein [Fimbriimonadaceae bacterium]
MIEASNLSSNFSSTVLGVLYPPKCGLCGLLGPEPICSVCLGQMEPGARIVSDHELSFVATVFAYSGRAEQAVKRLKYDRVTSLAHPMARLLAEYAEREELSDPDGFIPVPMHWTRWCQRGFNQSQLLCEFLPQRKMLPSHATRVRPTYPQAQLPPERRETNLVGAFAAISQVQGLAITLIDDVYTTGHTAREIAKVLLAAGASKVGVLAFAGGH